MPWRFYETRIETIKPARSYDPAGDEPMTGASRTPTREDQASPYANSEDFRRVFIEGLNGLYQLSFLLTGDQIKAEKCFVSGIEDCVNENRVFREWVHSWAKRTVMKNAIRELRPRPSDSIPSASIPSHTQHSIGSGEHFQTEAVLELKDFERFVFVMCVLEHCSQHDCALLLECPISEVREAQVCALENLAGTLQPVSSTPVHPRIHDGYIGTYFTRTAAAVISSCSPANPITSHQSSTWCKPNSMTVWRSFSFTRHWEAGGNNSDTIGL